MGARRAAVVLLLLVLPLGAAACGGGKKSSSTTTTSASSPLDAVRAAAEKTAKAGSMQLALSAAATGSTTIAVAGAGGFDTTNHQGKLHLHFSTSGISSTLDVVLSGTDLYVTSPLFSLTLPAGKSWIKIDLTKGAKAAGVDLSSLLSQDPTQALDALENASTRGRGRHRQARERRRDPLHGHDQEDEQLDEGRRRLQRLGRPGRVHPPRAHDDRRHLELQHRSRDRDVHAVRLRAAGDGHRPAGAQTVDSNGSIPGLGG